MPYIHFTEEQKLRASSVDLVEFLRRQGEVLLRSGPEYRMASDHSVTVRGNEWYDHETRRGGGPISFVQEKYGRSYPEAVTILLEGEYGMTCAPAQSRKKEERKGFVPPPAVREARRLYAYLLKKRFIDREVLTAFVRVGLVYEDAVYHNAVFIGKDEHGVVRHAHKRSTSDSGKSFRVNVEGGDPRYSFHWCGAGDRLYVFEAPIDLLSFLTLYPKDWREYSYVALCGVGERALLWMLEQNKNICQVILCLDHDPAGIEAAGRLAEILREHGYEQVSELRPKNKDWNEDLKAKHGLEAQPAEEHPQLQAAEEVCARVALKCVDLTLDRAVRRVPLLFRFYRRCEEEGRLVSAMDCAEEMAALSLLAALREWRQLGAPLTLPQGTQLLQSCVLPHQNRNNLKSRTGEIGKLLQEATSKSGAQEAHYEEEKREIADAWLELALSCVKASVKYEADEMTLLKKQMIDMEMR